MTRRCNDNCCTTEEEQVLCVKYKVKFCVDIKNCEITEVQCQNG